MAPEAEVKEELASPPRQQEPSPEKLIPVKGEEEQLQALQLAAQGATVETFREKAHCYGTSVLKVCGGPWQFLQRQFPTAQARAEFGQYLRATYPAKYDLVYATSLTLPQDDQVRFLLSVADLGFDVSCSTKPPPHLHTALSLLDEILTRGFVSAGWV